VEHLKVLNGLYSILEESWTTADHTEDDRIKIQALSLARETEMNIQDTITNANVLGDAVRFMHTHNKVVNNMSTAADQTDQPVKIVQEEDSTAGDGNRASSMF